MDKVMGYFYQAQVPKNYSDTEFFFSISHSDNYAYLCTTIIGQEEVYVRKKNTGRFGLSFTTDHESDKFKMEILYSG